MRYTQAQVRDVLNLSDQTLRYWAKVVPHLKKRAGRAPKYTLGDILGLAIVKELCDGLSINIGPYSTSLDEMFLILNGTSWLVITNGTVRLSPRSVEFIKASGAFLSEQEYPSIFLPCLPIATKVREKIVAAEPELGQMLLPLPLTPLSAADKNDSLVVGDKK